MNAFYACNAESTTRRVAGGVSTIGHQHRGNLATDINAMPPEQRELNET